MKHEIVDIETFSMDIMRSILGIQEEAKELDNVKKNIKKHSFESQVEEF